MSSEMPPIQPADQQPVADPNQVAEQETQGQQPAEYTPQDDGLDSLFDPKHEGSVEAAARDPRPTPDPAAIEAQQQMDVSAADRLNREDAGLDPRVHDLT